MHRLLRQILPGRHLCLALLLALGAHSAFAQGPASMETTFKAMLSALQAGSLENFIAAGDASFKSGMTKEMLDSVGSQLAPRLNGGYTSSFLGTLKQQGYTIYLWKLEFKDGKDDRLATMAVKDGKVAGFFLR
jgi:hypothetical protein